MSGWIKLHRKSLDHWLYSENRPHTKREAWEDILLLVNHAPEKVLLGEQLVVCERGQSLKSLDSWAKLFGWHKSRVRRFFDLLKSDGMIETKAVTKTTQLTVCNYEDYQDVRHDGDTIMTRTRHDGDTIVTPNKNDKNIKNDKKNKKEGKTRFTPPSQNEVLSYFLEKGLTPGMAAHESSKFLDYYTSNGWKVGGRAAMKDWKAAVRNWIKNCKEFQQKRQTPGQTPKQPQSKMDFARQQMENDEIIILK